MHGRRLPLKLKATVNKRYVRPAILHESKAWCLKEMGILRRTERSIVRAMCGVQLKVKKISMDLMLLLGLNETIDQLAIANSVCLHGHVLRRENCDIMRALDFEADGQRKIGRMKRT